MIKTITTIVMALSLVSSFALAKGKKSNEDSPTLLSAKSQGTPWSQKLKGLSIVGGYDLADEAELKTGDIETDKSFAVGAEYEFDQIAPGVAWQVGGLYEFKKDINDSSAKYTLWTGYAEVVGKLTQQFKVMGGINYNNPDLSGADGAKLEGDLGFQLGGSYMPTKNFAMDLRFRSIKMDYTEDTFNGKFKSSVKSEGLMFSGRYIF